MAVELHVRVPFGALRVGDRITDPAEVEKMEREKPAHFFVRVEVPASPVAEPPKAA